MRVPRSLYFAMFSFTASIGVIFGLIASLQDDLGFANSALGLIAAASFFASFLGQLFLAPLADRGKTKPLLLFSIILAVGKNNKLALFRIPSESIIFVFRGSPLFIQFFFEIF